MDGLIDHLEREYSHTDISDLSVEDIEMFKRIFGEDWKYSAIHHLNMNDR